MYPVPSFVVNVINICVPSTVMKLTIAIDLYEEKIMKKNLLLLYVLHLKYFGKIFTEMYLE